MTTNLDVFNNYTNRNFDNLSTYRVCDDDEDCLKYMFVNGQDIYHELDMFNEIPFVPNMFLSFKLIVPFIIFLL